jgi:DNA-3-methyladenine glycosylase
MESIDKKLGKNINKNINENINKNINENINKNNISVNNIQHKSTKNIYKFEDYFIFWN